jgi:hypothetical protein
MHDCGEKDGILYLVMNNLPGEHSSKAVVAFYEQRGNCKN